MPPIILDLVIQLSILNEKYRPPKICKVNCADGVGTLFKYNNISLGINNKHTPKPPNKTALADIMNLVFIEMKLEI
jgi:hypothetical protein